jgi:SAM-dependent methyltransferase
MTPDWQLPDGVDRGLWDYIRNDRVAREYDDALAGSPLMAVDVEYARRQFLAAGPGRLIDLGCGSGRLLIPMARAGFRYTGVDLSTAMLDVVREKATQAGVPVDLIEANLVALDEIADRSFDSAACLFSTLGMIRGRANRHRFLCHVHRLLTDKGVFVVHVHNACYRFGIGLGRKGSEPGDRTMPQHRGGAELTLHHFRWQELAGDLLSAGFVIDDSLPVGVRNDGTLACPWLLPRYRAHGYLVRARKPVARMNG